jgi:ATP-dependent DNA ligase
MKQLPVIYKRTKTGAIQQWQIIVKDNTFYTIEGQLDGKMTTSKPTVCNAKNVGRANSTSPSEQAFCEAQAKWTKKTENGYKEQMDVIDEGKGYFESMLAKSYKDYEDKIVFPVYVNVKLDGIRAIITKDGATTRNGKKHCCIPHILESLAPFFDKYPSAILDGEIYSHELHDDFNKISSLIRKTKPTKEDLAESKSIVQYHVYDCPQIGQLKQSAPFIERFNMMASNLKNYNYIHIVEAYTVTSKEEIIKYHEKFVSEGYEGIIVRLNKAYENKRSKHLLKYKVFDDAEFKILDICAGQGNKSDMAGYMVFKTKEGIDFTSNIKGTHEYLKDLLINKHKYVGEQATIKYFGLTPDKSVPRFPYVICIRNFE